LTTGIGRWHFRKTGKNCPPPEGTYSGESEMNTYYVVLKIAAGEYEKSSESLRQAENEEDAKYAALVGESHDDEEDLEWADGGVYDCGGEFHYKVRSCRLVAPEDVAVMEKYMWGVA